MKGIWDGLTKNWSYELKIVGIALASVALLALVSPFLPSQPEPAPLAPLSMADKLTAPPMIGTAQDEYIECLKLYSSSILAGSSPGLGCGKEFKVMVKSCQTFLSQTEDICQVSAIQFADRALCGLFGLHCK